MRQGMMGRSGKIDRDRYPYEVSSSQPIWKIVPISLAIFIPIALPVFHMIFLDAMWGSVKRPVVKEWCKCPCWDTIFKGDYENGSEVEIGYKHVYFNSTLNTFKIWTLTVIFVLFLYSSFRRFFSLLFSGQIRWSMGILFLSNLRNQYLVWWDTWNYMNDGFHSVYSQQLVFTVTEAVSFSLVLFLMDDYVATKPFGLLVLMIVSVFNAVSGSMQEEFIDNVIFNLWIWNLECGD